MQPSPPVNNSDHPQIQFWSQSDYKKWEKGPEAPATIATRGPLPYLKDYNSSPLPEATITAMMKKMQAI
jgi:hypothetical protein